MRDRADARLAGVCAALARSWQIEPLVVRVAFVALTPVTSGFALTVYLVLWAMLPRRGSTTTRTGRVWAPLAVIGALVAGSVLFGVISSGAGLGALVLLGTIWLVMRLGGRRPPEPPAVAALPRTPFERASMAWQQRLDNVRSGRPADFSPELVDPDPAGLYGPDVTPAVADVTRRRGGRHAWLRLLIALGVAWSALALVQRFGVPVSALGWTSATLGVLGLGLVISAAPRRAGWGRPPLLLFTTLLVAAATAFLLVVPGSGHTPRSGDSVGVTDARTRLGVVVLPPGEHSVALDAPGPEAEPVSYALDVGDLVVQVPTSGNVVVHASNSVGELVMPDGTYEGIDNRAQWERITDPDAPTLVVDVHVGAGSLQVRS